MSKVTITFDRDQPDDDAKFQRAIKADAAYAVLWDISQKLFRPARKHGYADRELSELFDKSPDYAQEIIGLLETRFYELLKDAEIDL